MYCHNCGAQLPENSKFCNICGARIDDDMPEAKIVQIKCKSCGGTIKIKPEQYPILECPYCKSTELIVEKSEVAIERIKSQTAQNILKEKLKHDEALEKQRIEFEKERKKQDKIDKFKKGGLSKIIIIFAAICIAAGIVSFNLNSYIRFAIAVIQVALLIIAWLTGMQFIAEKRTSTHVAYTGIAFLLSFVFIFIGFKGVTIPSIRVTKEETTKEVKTFVWPRDGLSVYLPKVETSYGNILIDDDDEFFIDIDDSTVEQYMDYKDLCIEKGFVLEAKRGTNSYEAFNDDGYSLSVRFSDYSNQMTIILNAPPKKEEITWPTEGYASTLPVPACLIGEVALDGKNHYLVYITNTSKESYNEYVEKCKNAGYTVDISKSDNIFDADNNKEYSLRVEYVGMNVMSISLYSNEEY